MSDINWAAWLPLILLAVAIIGYGLFDLNRSEVKYLPKWAWALICLLSVPFGTIVYLTVGREGSTRPDRP
ncbi:MAG: PLDc N-terminal domain-containing protein [Acidimicrobiia bacterium]|nr:PLDc N-terminal domain-containing protein [Acidimicrobiia bacterium]MDH5503293.1 PLDc N-terminal domain-containing protein [Acidimicrobiia bacterium]